MTQPEVLLEKERDFSEVFNVSFSFLSQEVKGLFKVVALYGGIPIIGVVLFSAFYTQNVMESLLGAIQGASQGMSSGIDGFSPSPFMIFLAIFLGMGLYAYLWGLIAAYMAVYLEKGHHGFHYSEVWALFVKRLGAVIGYSLLAGILTMVATLFLIIPGIYVSVPLSLVVMIKVVEGRPLGETLSRCFQLVRHNWWLTFAIVLVAYLIISSLGFLFSLPAAVFGAVKGFLAASGNDAVEFSSTFLVLGTVMSELGKYLLYPIFFVIIGIQYFSLKEKKDLSGLNRKVSGISEQK